MQKVKTAQEPYYQEAKKLEEQIKELILIRGKSYNCGHGDVTYRKGATRRAWDLNKLDAACEVYPEVKDKIYAFRTETTGAPVVIIKINEEGKSASEI